MVKKMAGFRLQEETIKALDNWALMHPHYNKTIVFEAIVWFLKKTYDDRQIAEIVGKYFSEGMNTLNNTNH